MCLRVDTVWTERGVSVAEYGVTPLSDPALFDCKENLFVSLQSISGKDTDLGWRRFCQ